MVTSMKFCSQPLTIRISMPEYLALKEAAEDKGISMRAVVQGLIKETYPDIVKKYRKELKQESSKTAGGMIGGAFKAFRN